MPGLKTQTVGNHWFRRRKVMRHNFENRFFQLMFQTVKCTFVPPQLACLWNVSCSLNVILETNPYAKKHEKVISILSNENTNMLLEANAKFLFYNLNRPKLFKIYYCLNTESHIFHDFSTQMVQLKIMQIYIFCWP